jgi:hypothetical protein
MNGVADAVAYKATAKNIHDINAFSCGLTFKELYLMCLKVCKTSTITVHIKISIKTTTRKYKHV